VIYTHISLLSIKRKSSTHIIQRRNILDIGPKAMLVPTSAVVRRTSDPVFCLRNGMIDGVEFKRHDVARWDRDLLRRECEAVGADLDGVDLGIRRFDYLCGCQVGREKEERIEERRH
jgi:hypothetical protein